MSDQEKTTAEAPAAKKGKKKLLMIVAVGFMVAAGAGGYVMLGAGGDAAAKEPEPGDVVVMDAVTVNLKDGHYLKIKIALQATADAAHEPEGSKALDLAIDQFSEYEMGELSTTEGRHKAKETLREHVTEAYHGDVMDVYFTEFVMQ